MSILKTGTRETVSVPLGYGASGDAGQLLTFGSPTFSTNTKIGTKSLILLSYVSLEGSRSRLELSRLFWSHLEGQHTDRGESKDLKNYGVVRATLKRELGVDIEDSAQVAAIPCDAQLFVQGVDEGRAQEALGFYRRGSFLAGADFQSRLHLSAEVLDWLDAKRALFAQLAQTALLEVAQNPHQNPQYRACATKCAEKTYEAERGSHNLGLLTELYHLLSELGSPLAADARRKLERQLETLVEELTPEAFRFYLLLSLQDVPNLAAAQIAANLSPQAGSMCAEELRSARLISTQNTVLNHGAAELYLEQHVGEKVALLCDLAQSTPVEQACSIFQALYTTNHTFGGAGYWEKAQKAYYEKAKALLAEQNFEAVVATLGQLEQAEIANQKQPLRKGLALQAYALECLNRDEEALAKLT